MRIRVTRWKASCALVLAVGTLLAAGETFAAVRLPKIFGDGMVLQRDMAVPVWGWAKAGEKVTVGFAGRQKSATADASGQWRVRLDAMPASKSPREMTVAGENTLTLKDVLVGEVWFCGGQSNMDMWLDHYTYSPYCLLSEAEKAAATDSAIRQIKVSYGDAAAPADDLPASSGPWTACAPATVGRFTAVGYFFAREIAREVDVPIGLINDNCGGSCIGPWTPPEGFRAVPEMHDLHYTGDGVLFNGMTAPVIPYAIRGMLWYQGESNGGEGVTYLYKMKALIGSWRQLWGECDFPVYYVQLPNFQQSDPNKPAGGDGWARLREAQLQSLAIPNTGMAVTIDIGDAADIHPRNKQDVGHRLALWALARTYGKDLVFSGPLYKSHAVEGDKIRITFNHVGGGLIVGAKNELEPVQEVPSGKLKWFAIAGEDKIWYWADAVIDGQTVLVSSDKVARPVAIRYAFTANPEGANLYNKEGLPASPFRTDDWK